MPHYICKQGCKGVSDTPGTCQAKDCPGEGQQLEECDCEDGKHYGAFEGLKEDTAYGSKGE